ncbi:MAG TPA: hypothetical protein VKX17_01245 [Planctomycetota bacterium]|nr:hypothetical protein [Planctomycetota bacterium]
MATTLAPKPPHLNKRPIRRDPNDLPARLKELAQLKSGWLNGAGVAPAAAGLKWLSDAWLKYCPEHVPEPFAYPTPEGNVQLEWDFGSWEISAEVDLVTHQASLMAVNAGTGDEAEDTADLSAKKGWSKLGTFVRSLA